MLIESMGGSRGGTGGPGPPLKNHKNVEFPSNIGPDPLKSQSYQAIIHWLGILSARQRNAISMAFRLRADDG